MHGLPDRLEEINTKIVKLSKEIAGGRAYVAGDMTTTGRMLEPAGDISYEKFWMYTKSRQLFWQMQGQT